MDAKRQLYLEHLQGQAQFAYFQLGGAASAIAFAVHETEGHALAVTPWPLGVAVLLWAASFAFGCFGVSARQGGLLTNLKFLDLQDQMSRFRADAELGSFLEQAKSDTQKMLNRPLARFKYQLWTLFAGAIFYLAGHVMEMATTPAPPRSPVSAVKPSNL